MEYPSTSTYPPLYLPLHESALSGNKQKRRRCAPCVRPPSESVSLRDIKIQNEIWTVWMAIATRLPAAVAELCFVDGRVDGGQSSVFG